MLAFILRRLLITIPMLFGITFLTFVIVNAQGNPVADLQRNPRFRPADIERIRENMGLNEPVPVRYVKWVSNLVRGDLGISLSNATPVRDRIVAVLPNTVLLTGVSLVFSFLLSIPLGIYSATKRGSWFDHTVTVLSVAAFAMPTFWLALLLILLFSSQFREWGLPSLPVSGMYDARRGGGFFDRVEHLILPVVALSISDPARFRADGARQRAPRQRHHLRARLPQCPAAARYAGQPLSARNRRWRVYRRDGLCLAGAGS